MEVMPKDVTAAVARIRRRKGISGNDDITVTLIANEVKCSRATLYKKSLDKVMAPFKKIKNKESSCTAAPGSIEYLKDQLAKRDIEIARLNKELSQSKDWQIDQEIQQAVIDELQKDKERLQKEVDSRYEESYVIRLSKENASLRDQLLRIRLGKNP